MRVFILNQYKPPDPSPTAKLVGDLAAALRGEGHQVVMIDSGQDYRVRAKSRYSRAGRELKALSRLLCRGLLAGRADVVISTSSPPAILLVATALCALKRAKSVHWALDLYPELALALGGAVPAPIRSILHTATGSCYRATTRTICLDADMRDHLKRRYGIDTEIIRPWLLHGLDRTGPGRLAYPSRDGFTWLYSGNLGQAHDWETAMAAQRILEDRGCPVTLAFQGGGASWEPARRRAEQLKLARVEWRPYAPEDRLTDVLLQAHAMLVTQKPCTRGLLWPSKLGLLMCLPRPLIFIGPENGAIAREIRVCGYGECFPPGAAGPLAGYVQNLYEQWPPGEKPSLRPGWTFEQAWKAWRRVLQEVSGRL
ncbi:MAG: glycosyltransferase family 4 protein [Verrucomicrobia bacterium]|nr:glycosyltransferase family 4 protein [Verrucomicrobiota bacterium]